MPAMTMTRGLPTSPMRKGAVLATSIRRQPICASQRARYFVTLVAMLFILLQKVEDRKSIFQAHVAQVHSKEDVAEMTRILLSDRRIARATHNIMACRYRDAKTGALRQDNDDDGETAAGSRLAHLLGVIDATDVCVIVSRWYGGIQLGPDRFRRINEVARQQLELEGFIPLKGSASTAAAAKGKKSKK